MNDINENDINITENIIEEETDDIDPSILEDSYLEKVRQLYNSLINIISVDSIYYDPNLFKSLTFKKFLKWHKTNF